MSNQQAMVRTSEDNAGEAAFAFGRNWRQFLDDVATEERVRDAQRSLQQLLRVESLEGVRWIDIGCGSGLFSLAAHRLGAGPMLSFDVDEDSVGCCRELWQREEQPADWKVAQGSVLDEAFLASIEPADVVYSWGVLHHTGQMWRAIENAAGLVRPGGLFAIAIYNRLPGLTGSVTWLRIKKTYVSSPRWVQWLMERAYLGYYVASLIAHGRNPVAWFRRYREARGMSVMTDLIDWVGGYPYEFAAVDEIFCFARDRLGMELVNLVSVPTLGNNQFVFRKREDAGR